MHDPVDSVAPPIPAFGIHSLDHFTMAVPDLAQAQDFYTAFGLDVQRQDDRLTLRTFGDSHIWADIVAGDRKQLLAIRFGAYERDLAELARRLADVRIAHPPADTNGIWCLTPDGLPIEIVVAPKSSPDEKGIFELGNRAKGMRGTGSRADGVQVRPRRLAHLGIFTQDVSRLIDFFEERLGLRLSDRSGDFIAFLHGRHGSDHHLVAIALAGGPGLHHCSWDVGSLAEVGLGAMQMAASGYQAGWGLGRHVLGSNYFHYVRDPWGSHSEYSADMDYIPEGADWPAADHPGHDSAYLWGPGIPADFGTNFEIEPFPVAHPASSEERA